MLKINLLPESSGRSSRAALQQLPRLPIAKILAVGLVLFPLLLWLPTALGRYELKRLTAAIKRLEPKQQELERLQQSLGGLRAQESAFRILRGQRVWAKRLNTLSDLTPDGIWLSDLLLDFEKGLTIQGFAIGQGGSETGSIGRLVQSLKDSPDFASATKDIQIESIKRTQDRDVELLQFTLRCALSDALKLPSTP